LTESPPAVLLSHDLELMLKSAPVLDPTDANYDRQKALWWDASLEKWYNQQLTLCSDGLKVIVKEFFDEIKKAELSQETVNSLSKFEPKSPSDKFVTEYCLRCLVASLTLTEALKESQLQLKQLTGNSSAKEVTSVAEQLRVSAIKDRKVLHQPYVGRDTLAGREALANVLESTANALDKLAASRK